MIGQTLLPYEIVEKLGEGGMGAACWLAAHTWTGLPEDGNAS